jgi:hypothetical protein
MEATFLQPPTTRLFSITLGNGKWKQTRRIVAWCIILYSQSVICRYDTILILSPQHDYHFSILTILHFLMSHRFKRCRRYNRWILLLERFRKIAVATLVSLGRARSTATKFSLLGWATLCLCRSGNRNETSDCICRRRCTTCDPKTRCTATLSQWLVHIQCVETTRNCH